MTQQTFPITGRKPRVVITRVNGNLNVQPWEREEIGVNVSGTAEVVRQEGDTLTIIDCQGDLELWIPDNRNRMFRISTSITATDVSRNATLEGAGNVDLKDVGGMAVLKNIGGNVELVNIAESVEATNIGGNLRAAHLPRLGARRIGGNVTLLDIRQIEADAIGGNLAVTDAETVTCSTVGGDLDVEHVEKLVRGSTIGGNCEVHNCQGAEVNVGTVGGNYRCDGAVIAHSSMVGGNLHLQAGFPAESQARFHVGGNAYITLLENANLAVHAMVGGNSSGSSTVYSKGGGLINLVYGEGVAKLHVTVGGNLKLIGGGEPRRTGGSLGDFGRGMAGLGLEMGRVGLDLGRDIFRAIGDF